MIPDRTNYEIWIIDYLDGKLDEEQTRQLVLFLEQNPDLKEESEEFSRLHVTSELAFKGKSRLKKAVIDLPYSQFELLCIAATENDITEEQYAEMNEIISGNPKNEEDLKLIRKLKLNPPDIRYPKKSSLKHLTLQQKVIRLSLAGIAVAAGIAFLIILKNTSGINTGGSKQNVSQNVPLINNETPAQVKKEQVKVKAETVEKLPVAKISVKNTFIPQNQKNNSDPDLKMPTDKPVENKQELRPVEIAMVTFIQEVKVSDAKITGSLVTLNNNQKQITDLPEKTGINEYLARFFREKILKSKTPETGSLKAYEVADAGIIGINKLLGWDMSLKQTRDDKGELKSFYFSSKIIKFNAPVKKALAAL